MKSISKEALARWGVCGLLFIMGVTLFPHHWCGRYAKPWYDGDAQLQNQLARTVERYIQTDLTRKNFSTGSNQFDGEWLFGTYFMAGMGFGQTALEHPELRSHHLELLSICIDKMLSEKVRAFDTESWGGHDPLKTMTSNEDHAAYLGYLNLLLSFERWFNPHSKHAALNDQITITLVHRLEQTPLKLLHTYPSEIYPVDNCAVIASIGLYDKATGSDHQKLIQDWIHLCRTKYRDPHSGLLFQGIEAENGNPGDSPRGSGTTFGLYFLSFIDIPFSRELYLSAHRELSKNYLGFGMLHEYPKGMAGIGDIDSGPVLFGIGLSPTGFMIAGTRIHRDRRLFTNLFKTSVLFGAPLHKNNRIEFVTGGPLGNAIMFAMLTALPNGLPVQNTSQRE